MNHKIVVGIVASLIVTGVAALIGLAINVAEYRAATDVRIEQLEKAKEKDESQDAQIKMHWKRLGWCRQQINRLFQHSGQPIPDEPVD